MSWVVFILIYFTLCTGLSIPAVMFTGGIIQIALINLFGILPLLVSSPILLKMQGFNLDRISKSDVINITLIIVVGVAVETACGYFTETGINIGIIPTMLIELLRMLAAFSVGFLLARRLIKMYHV